VRPVRIGCSGWNYRDWRGPVYPPKLPARRWLEHYARLFETVEVNATFYRLPRREAVAAWVGETPDGFLFAVKASRYLTHVRRLREISDGVAVLYERLEPLIAAERLGPVLWQLPETFHREDGRLAAALAALPPGRHAFEFRHPSWFVPEIYGLLRAHGAALVVGDHPERRFQAHELTADWTYVRFHAGLEPDGGYGEEELDSWAELLRRWRSSADVYAYFNNDWQALAVANAASLRARLVETI
jgi:uncharacterized protein YecE (DUF72 family)